MNISFFRLLPVVANWFPHKKTVIDGQYVDKVVILLPRYYPMGVALKAANDNSPPDSPSANSMRA
jgi:hypothetical protein